MSGLAFRLFAPCLLLLLCVAGDARALGDTEQQRVFSPSEVRELQQRAASGDAESAYHLGLALILGQGVAVDFKAGKLWLEQAADQGHVPAIGDLARAYLSGRLGDDRAAAFAWAKRLEGVIKTPEHTRYYATLALFYDHGIGVETDQRKAAEYYEKALPSGMGYAHFRLAELMMRGVYGPPDYGRILKHLHAAWNAGETQAAAQIGGLYESGLGVPQDKQEAIRYLRLAAEKGDWDAMSWLALRLYHNAKTVSEASEAIQWFERVASRPLDTVDPKLNQLRMIDASLPLVDPLAVNAHQQLGQLYAVNKFPELNDCNKSIQHLRRVLTTENDRLARLRQAAAITMGMNYRDGCGVPRDLVAARSWMERGRHLNEEIISRLIREVDEMIARENR